MPAMMVDNRMETGMATPTEVTDGSAEAAQAAEEARAEAVAQAVEQRALLAVEMSAQQGVLPQQALAAATQGLDAEMTYLVQERATHLWMLMGGPSAASGGYAS